MSYEPLTPLEQMNDAQWRRVRDVVEELERLWRAGSRPDWKSLAPPPGDPVRGAALVELAKVDLEYSWHNGERRAVEQYLRDAAELTTAAWARRELVETECVTRAFLDALPDSGELHERFPDLAPKIDLAGIRRLVRVERETTVRVGPPQGDTSEDTTCPTQIATGNTPLPPPSIGQKLGDRYEILGILGKGGMGAVYRARDAQLQREVALKIPRFDNTSDTHARERFFREARAAARVEHVNVCRVYDVGEADGHPYFTMALVEGGSLAERLKAGPMAPPAAAEMMVKLLAALAAIHDQGIIHRDLKPSNVLLARSGEPLLTDFGLARWSAPAFAEPADQPAGAEAAVPASAVDAGLTRPSLAPGTLHYMSPEQHRGDTVDHRSDIYSLGLVLFEMLTGRRMFEGTPEEIRRQILAGPSSRLPYRRKLSAALEQICLKATAREPEERFQTAREMQQAIGLYLERHRTRVSRMAVAVAAAASAAALGLMLYVKTGHGTLNIEVSEPDVAVTIDGEHLSVHSPRDQIEVDVGEHHLTVAKDGFHTETRAFHIDHNGATELSVEMIPISRGLDDIRTVASDLTAIAGTEWFHDRFDGPALDESLWHWGQTDKISYLKNAGQSFSVTQSGGRLNIEAHAPLHESGYSVIGVVWADSAEDLKCVDDIEIRLRLSGRVQHGRLALEISDGSVVSGDPDPNAVTLFELRPENCRELDGQYFAISIYGSAQRATLWTSEGPRYGAANLDLSVLKSWKLRFHCLAASSSGTLPGSAAWMVDEVIVRRISAQSGILGRVVDERLGSGIEQATVRAAPGETVKTRDDGTFMLIRSPGEYDLQVFADDYAALEPRKVVVEPGRRAIADVAMRPVRFGYGDPVRYYQLDGETISAVAIGSDDVYYIAGIEKDCWLFKLPKSGGPAVRLTSLRDADCASNAIIGGGLAWIAGEVYALGTWPMRLYRVPAGGDASLIKAFEIEWPWGLAPDGRQLYFWYHANNADHTPRGVYTLNLDKGNMGLPIPAEKIEAVGVAWGNGRLWLSTKSGRFSEDQADRYIFEVDLDRARRGKWLEDGFVRQFRGEFTALTFGDGLLWGLDPTTKRLWGINISDKPIPAQ